MQEAVRALEPPFREPVEEGLRAVVEAGGGDREGLIRLLHDWDLDEGTLATACWLLARLGATQSVPALLRLLEDERTSTGARAQAAVSLGQVGDAETAVRLAAFLSREADLVLRQVVVNAIGHLGNTEVAGALLRILRDIDEEPALRGEAAEALGNLKARGKEVVSALVTSLDDPSPDVRFFSAFALGAVGTKAVLPQLERVAAEDEGVAEPYGSVAIEAKLAIDAITGRIRKRAPRSRPAAGPEATS